MDNIGSSTPLSQHQDSYNTELPLSQPDQSSMSSEQPTSKRRRESTSSSSSDDDSSHDATAAPPNQTSPSKSPNSSLDQYKDLLVNTEAPLNAAKLYFTEACHTLLKDLSPDQSTHLGNQFSKLLRLLKIATSKEEKLSNEDTDPKPLCLKPFITCSPTLRESDTFKEIQRKEKAAQDSYIKGMKALLAEVAKEEHEAAKLCLVNFLCDTTRKFARYIFLSRHKGDFGVVQYEDCIDAIAYLALKRAITPITTTIPAPPEIEKYWFGMDVESVKSLFTFNNEQFARAEGRSELHINQGADLCTNTVQNMTKVIICGAIDVYNASIKKHRVKEEIQVAFQSASLELATQQTIIELDNDGPDNVTQTTISRAHMNQIMTSLRKEFHLTPKNEERGANTVSASIKKKKTQSTSSASKQSTSSKKKKQKRKEIAAESAINAATKAARKAAKAKAKAKKAKKTVRFDALVEDNGRDSRQQKKRAASRSDKK